MIAKGTMGVILCDPQVNISIYCCRADIRIHLLLDNELDRKIDVTPMQFLLVQNRHKTLDQALMSSAF